MRRGLWFAAGAVAGAYGVIRARRAAEVFTPEGLRDRAAGLTLGAQLFGEEVRAGMAERETELRERMGLMLDGSSAPRELAGGLDTPADAGYSTDEDRGAGYSTDEGPVTPGATHRSTTTRRN